eukprot:CAMPEP_0178931374 /NCGR_PEP_ID=MMETSP0786-20121207/21879_1 /TAXON_ID=186022 /ORGANISM="Thalassionema frauenfeldii, Strain CCMP 1798" /LENGTH=55 /DNA_ID=CAMNT_0020608253 /DNA_START=1213 /DNA_END=1377 /DNA_ORIENTATION=-
MEEGSMELGADVMSTQEETKVTGLTSRSNASEEMLGFVRNAGGKVDLKGGCRRSP